MQPYAANGSLAPSLTLVPFLHQPWLAAGHALCGYSVARASVYHRPPVRSAPCEVRPRLCKRQVDALTLHEGELSGQELVLPRIFMALNNLLAGSGHCFSPVVFLCVVSLFCFLF